MKSVLLCGLWLLVAASALGQEMAGHVNFSSAAESGAQLLTTNRNLTAPLASGNLAPAGQYVVGLFMGAPGSDFSSLTPVGYAVNSTLPGLFNGSGNYVLPAPYYAGTTAAFQVRSWSTGLGLTWDEVSSKVSQYDGTGNARANFDFTPGTYYLGSSSIGWVVPAGGLQSPSILFGTRAGEVLGFALDEVMPIPEPTNVVLACIGFAAWLLFRRRQRWRWLRLVPRTSSTHTRSIEFHGSR